MLAARHSTNLLVVLVASTLAGCCCCPPLSCRYGDPGCPAAPAMAGGECGGGCGGGHAAAIGAADHATDCEDGGHWPLFAHGPWMHEPVPSKQHYDYVSPTPKYHPVPTRPVFEPQPEYPPPHQLAGPEPRRNLLHESHVLPLHHQQAAHQPAPYQQAPYPQARPLRCRDEPTPAQPPQ